jgi:hypothetical protein
MTTKTKPSANQIQARKSMIKALKLTVEGNVKAAKKELTKANRLLNKNA